MEKLNLRITVLLLFSCSGTTFSMQKALTKKSELTSEQKKIAALYTYMRTIQKINKKRELPEKKFGSKSLDCLEKIACLWAEISTGFTQDDIKSIKSEEELKELILRNSGDN